MSEGKHDHLSGRCLCGRVEIGVAQHRPGVDVCHCDMCRRWCGGPFFSLRGVKADALDIRGEDHIVRYRSSEWAERASCARCGSNLWYNFVPGGTYALMAGLFALPRDYQVREQIFVDERPEWAKLSAVSDEKTGAQVIDEAKAGGFDLG